jgi:beta-N-acetylhexosaminidase
VLFRSDLAASRFEGQVTAREARAIGVQWVLAPDADVNNNPDNPIINIRSYGEDPKAVAANLSAFLEGTRADPKYRVLVTAKHFPGHGDTAVDSHIGLPRLDVDRARLDRIELPPFREAIQDRVDAIMSAHIALPALDSPDTPSTLSYKILTGLLREQLGFHGLIVTDALDMRGIADRFGPAEAAVRAFEAGADVLLMPENSDEAVRAVLAAVEKGRIKRARLDESVTRILTAKARVGLDRKRVVNLEEIGDQLDSPEVEQRAQEIADRAVTLVKNDANVVPLTKPAAACFLVLSEGRYSMQGRKFVEEARRRAPAAQITLLDPSAPDAELDAAAQKAAGCDTVVVAAFVAVSAYRGNVALPGNYPKLLTALIASHHPVVLISLGNPYLLRSFPDVSAYLATFSTVPTSETAAVKALWGEIPITGKSPVVIVQPSAVSHQPSASEKTEH